MTNQSPTTTPDPVCPLANDSDGNPVALPEGASAWRVRRHTGGRPRIQLGPDKQPMQLPLSYTLADLDDILPPGVYRLDLVDATGESLGLTKQINIGQLRNASESNVESDTDRMSIALSTATASPPISDTRFLLEANVRSTQLAFEHNRQTLELGLRMAETLRDGVHVLADAQADILKSVASSRGFLRNAQPAPLALPPPKPAEPDDDDDDEDDEEEAPADDKNERLMAFGMSVITLVNNLVETFRGGQRPATGQPTAAMKSSGFDLGSIFDWRRAVPQAEPAATTPASPASIMKFMTDLPAEMRSKLLAVRSQLSADEQKRLLELVMAIAPEDLPTILAELTPKSVEELVAFFRAQLGPRAAA